jgi:hypothetical protein
VLSVKGGGTTQEAAKRLLTENKVFGIIINGSTFRVPGSEVSDLSDIICGLPMSTSI